MYESRWRSNFNLPYFENFGDFFREVELAPGIYDVEEDLGVRILEVPSEIFYDIAKFDDTFFYIKRGCPLIIKVEKNEKI